MYFFFFFKQKTAYEMRISDWSSDVCSSDLMDFGKFKYESAMKAREARRNQSHVLIKEQKLRPKIDKHDYETKKRNVERFLAEGDKVKEIGRASCRERVWQ